MSALRLVGGVSQTRRFNHLASFCARLGQWLWATSHSAPCVASSKGLVLEFTSQPCCHLHREAFPGVVPVPRPSRW